MHCLNIEDGPALLCYLQQTGRVGPAERPRLTNLQGGISNRTVLIERVDGSAFVLKQALSKLRVATDWPSDPRRIQQEALGLTWLRRLAPPGSIPALLFEDARQHLVAMEAVPRPHENWKVRLLAGGLERKHVEQFGRLLGGIHRRSCEQQSELAPIFDDRTFFESLRIEPYYRYTASRDPEAASFFAGLITETEATHATLVHGDYSPKNILVSPTQFVLLDHEVIHWGDPAFDIGFSLTHLLSKAHHLAAHREELMRGARLYWETYQGTAGQLCRAGGFEGRAVRHTLGCLLARVDGRSPLEYLNVVEQQRQRTIVLALMKEQTVSIAELIERFEMALPRPAAD